MKEDRSILITGAARSGTSMVAGIIRICGAFGGRVDGPDRGMNRGMMENVSIHDSIVGPYLIGQVVDPLGQYPLPDVGRLLVPVDWRTKVEGAITEDGYRQGPWFYKSTKTALIWPVWHYAFPGAKWIIVRRKTGDIISSCLKTRFMRAFSDPAIRDKIGVNNEREGWLWWVHQHEQRFVEMITEGLNCKVVWPERMVYGDYQQMYETIEWLGLKWKSEVLSFIDPKLWKARREAVDGQNISG